LTGDIKIETCIRNQLSAKSIKFRIGRQVSSQVYLFHLPSNEQLLLQQHACRKKNSKEGKEEKGRQLTLRKIKKIS